MSKAPNGPTVKMHLQNLHTMDELHFTGNCLKGSRPILSFDSTFDAQPHLRVIKELFLHVFGVPKTSKKTKPFIDHVMGFTAANGRIWIRCYQISETEPSKGKENQDAINGDDAATKKSKHGETNISLVHPRVELRRPNHLREQGVRFAEPSACRLAPCEGRQIQQAKRSCSRRQDKTR